MRTRLSSASKFFERVATRLVTYLSVAALLTATGSHAGSIRNFTNRPGERLTSHAQKSERPRLVPRFGYQATCTSAAFSADGKLVLMGYEDNSAILWQATEGIQLRRFKPSTPFDDQVSAVALSDDTRFAITGSKFGNVILWDAGTGEALKQFSLGRVSVSSIKISHDGRLLLITSTDGDELVSEWGTDDGRERWGHKAGVTCAEFSPDGRYIAAGTLDGSVRLQRAEAGGPVKYLRGHADRVTAVAFSGDGQLVLTASADATARLWDVGTGHTLRVFRGHADRVNAVAFLRDGRSVVTGSTDATARLWDVRTGKTVRTFAGHPGKVISVTVSPDQKSLLAN